MLTWGQGTSPAECVLRWQRKRKRAQWERIRAEFYFFIYSAILSVIPLSTDTCILVFNTWQRCRKQVNERAVHGTNWQEINTWPETRSWTTALSWGRGEGTAGWLTPQVVMTGSLNTLQHSWQQSLTEGCSANTCGSWVRKESKGRERDKVNLLLGKGACLSAFRVTRLDQHVKRKQKFADTHCVFLFLVQGKGRAQWHVGLGVQGANRDGRVWATRGTDGRLHGQSQFICFFVLSFLNDIWKVFQKADYVTHPGGCTDK